MRILLLHNRYQQKGGEDTVVQSEMELLRSHGEQVALLEENNDILVTRIARAQTAVECLYSPRAHQAALDKINEFHPDIVHIHNFFPRLSPAVHYVCATKKIPAVQTLHNYRLFCPCATCYRDSKICEDCGTHWLAWPAVYHKCYRGSLLASAAVSNAFFVHRLLHTWQRTVRVFIALTEFARTKFLAAGLPSERVTVKPNFVASDPGVGSGSGGYALFVGRLSAEKGIQVLLDAWRRLPAKWHLKIIGDGPMSGCVKEAARSRCNVQWLGTCTNSATLALMRDASILVFPSVWYECFPMVICEALATGLPILASRLGAMTEILCDGRTGKFFSAGSPAELADAVEWMVGHPEQLGQMRRWCRREYELKYTAERNYDLIKSIYRKTILDSTTAWGRSPEKCL